ncbi:hypothetical protein KEM56_002268 [Ascosphaera pollenicola]|nr:hypothetical protein KEM56_002268 [Ascosphaera pollenicola]
MGYIRQQYIHKLKEYKYSGVDHSLTSRYILKPFYQNVVIKCFPMWMARRTRQSGPLGELFDHAHSPSLAAAHVELYIANPQLAVFTFYVQTWEEYHTHTLTLGIFSGPVEGVLILCSVYGMTAYTGASFWHNAALPTLGVPQYDWIPDVVYQTPFTTLQMIQGAAVCYFNVGASIYQALDAVKARGENRREALKGLLPALEMWVLVVIYLYLQPGVLQCCTVGVILYVGLMNAFSVSQMICAHVTKAPFPYRNILTLPLYIAISDCLGRHMGFYSECIMGNHSTFIYASLGLALGVYGSFIHPYNENNEAKNK